MDNKKRAIIISVLLVLVVASLVSFCTWIPAAVSELRKMSPALVACDNATGGIVVDKKIVEKPSTLFHDGGTVYNLYIDVPYFEGNETKHITKIFSVSDITYRLYSLGDYFDIENSVNKK